MPKNESFVVGRSHCTMCNHTLRNRELIPLFSYIFLKGKCSECNKPISIRYPLIELINALLYVLIFFINGLSVESIIYSIISSTLIVIILIDYEHQIIPDELNIFLVLIGIIRILIDFNLQNLLDKGIGGLIGFITFLLLAILSKGAMGGGDIKMMGALGLIFGITEVLMISFFSFIFGAILSFILIITKIKGMKDYIPFGPFIALATFVTMFMGSKILDIYLNTL
jgi:leader peptidase (prepilin peptidase)/N-methyltransferase